MRTPHLFIPVHPSQVIVSTDVMARGVDLDRVNVVANLDLPHDSATYVHRWGQVQALLPSSTKLKPALLPNNLTPILPFVPPGWVAPAGLAPWG